MSHQPPTIEDLRDRLDRVERLVRGLYVLVLGLLALFLLWTTFPELAVALLALAAVLLLTVGGASLLSRLFDRNQRRTPQPAPTTEQPRPDPK